MNPFYDISTEKTLHENNLQLCYLGSRRIFAIIGSRNGESTNHYTDTTPEDYDNQFATKLKKWKPIYELEKLLEHHYQYYLENNPGKNEVFCKHLEYVVLPRLKKSPDNDTHCKLIEDWLITKKSPSRSTNEKQIVNNNTIQISNIHAPIQFQQNSDNSVQNQTIQFNKEDIKKAFELLSIDIKNMNEQIRADFSMEMNYAMVQLEKGKDIKQPMFNIGLLMKEIGLGVFENLAAAPIFEYLKPILGL